MHLSSSSAAGIRFLASVKHGHGLKPSARHAGIDKEAGCRWLREEYLRLRRNGKTPSETTAELGFTTSRLVAWEADVGQVKDRHHIRVDVIPPSMFAQWLDPQTADKDEVQKILGAIAEPVLTPQAVTDRVNSVRSN